MAVTATPIFPQGILAQTATIPGNTTTVLLTSAPMNGAKIENINVSSTSATPVTINLFVNAGGLPFLLSQFSIPANSGNSITIPSLNLLNNSQMPGLCYDNNGNKYLYLPNGFYLQATATATFTGTITFFTQWGIF